MILTRGLGYGGGLVARGFGAWIGDLVPEEVAVPPPITVGRRDMRQKRRAEMERATRRRREVEFFLIGMP